MSVLIKGMDMPKRCLDCPCYDWSDEVCRGEGVAEAFISDQLGVEPIMINSAQPKKKKRMG